MQKLSLLNNNNSVFQVDLVRYFSYDSEDYLIYTLNETDEKGYLKLYLVEILEELGELVCYTINDDDNWQKMQDVIKKVIKEIKNKKRELLVDKNPLEIDKLKIVNPRYFKLDKKLVDILCLDYLENVSDVDIDVDLDELDDMVIEAIPLPDDEVIILENGEDSNMIENNEVIETPIVSEPINENIEELPVEPVVTPEMPQEEINQVSIEEPVVENNEVETTEPVITPEAPIEPEVQQVVDNSNVSDEINYKELYFALKEEKEADNKLLDEMMNQLVEYQTKYGPLK